MEDKFGERDENEYFFLKQFIVSKHITKHLKILQVVIY